MDKIYVIGHKKPDTDSVTSAISLSYLKNKLGMNTIPMVLGNINNETKYVLEYFKCKIPNYLNDVKLQIKDINYGKDVFINENCNILETFNFMNENAISTVPVINDHEKFLGVISMKEISKDLIMGNFEKLDTTYNNIIKVLKAKELLKFNDDIKGNIIVASYKSTTFIENISLSNKDILIVGDRHSIIEYAVKNKVKLLILTGSSKIKDEHLEIAKMNNVNIIKTEFSAFNAARNIALSKLVKDVMNDHDIIGFNENDDVNDFIDVANKTKHSIFPVINNDNKCMGTIKLADLADKKRKRVILVDHNEYEQSVDGLEEAEIVEIIDHHKIGSLGTNMPINFRNMPVGSTNTIIYMLYKENNVTIPKNIAGLMLSGILSDTLLFASPTTADFDKMVVNELSLITKLDYKKYALNMFKAGSALKGKTEEEIFYTDFKNFLIDNKKIGISQVSTINADDILNNKANYINLINKLSKNNDYYIAALFVTDILNNGSYIIYNDNAEEILDNCFDISLEQGKFLPNLISRKKQIIPAIMEKIK
ncbi:MAG TPA: putative manganese-dependent inorganic diphosphatase [Bacilli bacterium]|nr:putative manganese-dependent inorganic diphosphatase [Bacilli bacterium]